MTQASNWRAEVIAPDKIIYQLDQFIHSLCEIEQQNLVGAYLHGSLAMGCFSLGRSDVDILVLLEQPPLLASMYAHAQAILHISGAPAPVETSFLHRRQYEPWQHPTPSCFHYSEDWRQKIRRELAEGGWQQWLETDIADLDLAGHFTVARRRGIRLIGKEIEVALPHVPWADYLDSTLRDFAWACERADSNPVYLVLNSCRTWAAVEEGLVLSKAEGAKWATPWLPPPLAEIAASAGAIYSGCAETPQSLTSAEALSLARWIAQFLPVQKEGPAIA
jgi:streptomycin 3"-adenylyltransferase